MSSYEAGVRRSQEERARGVPHLEIRNESMCRAVGYVPQPPNHGSRLVAIVDVKGIPGDAKSYRVTIGSIGSVAEVGGALQLGPDPMRVVSLEVIHSLDTPLTASSIRAAPIGVVLRLAKWAWVLYHYGDYWPDGVDSPSARREVARLVTSRFGPPPAQVRRGSKRQQQKVGSSRRTSSEVAQEAHLVAEAWWEWANLADTTGGTVPYRKWIAGHLGWPTDERSLNRVKEAMRVAQASGLVPRATSTRRRQPGGK